MDSMIVIGEYRPRPLESLEEIWHYVWDHPGIPVSRSLVPMYINDNTSVSTTLLRLMPKSCDEPPSLGWTRVPELAFAPSSGLLVEQLEFELLRRQIQEERFLPNDLISTELTPMLEPLHPYMAFLGQGRSLDGRQQYLEEHGSVTGGGSSLAETSICGCVQLKWESQERSQLHGHDILRKQLNFQTHTIDNVEIDNVKSKIQETWDWIDRWCLHIMTSLAVMICIVPLAVRLMEPRSTTDMRLPTDAIMRLVLILVTPSSWSQLGREPANEGKSTGSSASDGCPVSPRSWIQWLNHISCSIRAPGLLEGKSTGSSAFDDCPVSPRSWIQQLSDISCSIRGPSVLAAQ